MFYYDPTMLVLIPAVLFSLFAQFMVQSAYSRYRKVYGSKGYTGAQVTRFILDENGLQNIRIEPIGGELTDHYDPTAGVIRLSSDIYHSSSLAAVGVAAHECGHAIQHSIGYVPLKIRNAIIPITNIGSQISGPLIIIGLIFGWMGLAKFGIIAYSLLALFQLITLPVEFNASNRALKTIDEHQLLVGDERNGAKRVLTAAALTYVAALLSVLSNLLRFILMVGRRDDNN